MTHIQHIFRKFISPSRSLHQSCYLLSKAYVPKPVIEVVRQDSILKAIAQLDDKYPIKIRRLDEIGSSPTGWIDRMVPPPQLTYDVKRNRYNRFDIDFNIKGGKHRVYTSIRNIKGDIREMVNCLKWRLGTNLRYTIYEKSGKVHITGFHRKELITLLQALGF